MINEENIVLQLVSLANGSQSFDIETKADWQEVCDIACQQGVVGIVFDGLELLVSKIGRDGIPQDFVLQLYGDKLQTEKTMLHKKHLVLEFAENMSPLKGLVLKGLDFAQYWPKSLYREYGDFDCYYRIEFDKVNERASEMGAEVKYSTHKHSHIFYKGLMIENHASFTDYDGTEVGRKTEQRLKDLLACEKTHRIEDSNLYSPNPAFTVCFMLKHAQQHFMTEGIELRHFLDWMYFIDRCGGLLDRDKVVRLLDEMKLTNFAAMMTVYCISRLGWKNKQVERLEMSFNSSLLEKVDEWVFSEKADVQNKNLWYRGKRILKRFIRGWYFRKLNYLPYHKAVWTWIAYASTWNRKPKMSDV